MKKKDDKIRNIAFFSSKNGRVMTVHSEMAKQYLTRLSFVINTAFTLQRINGRQKVCLIASLLTEAKNLHVMRYYRFVKRIAWRLLDCHLIGQT